MEWINLHQVRDKLRALVHGNELSGLKKCGEFLG